MEFDGKKISFSLGVRPAADGDPRTAYDLRRKALFGSVLRGPAAEWFDSLDQNTTWPQLRNAFINRFTDSKDKYRKRIEVENIKRQPDELLKSYIHRITTSIDLGWPHPVTEEQRATKYMEYFVRGLTPPSLKQKAHQFCIEHPDAEWPALKDHVINKDLSYSVSAELSGNSVSNTLNPNSSKEIEVLQNQLKELTVLLKDSKVNAMYDPNNPRMKQNHTRFCNFCKRSGHTIKYCNKLKEEKQSQPSTRRPQKYLPINMKNTVDDPLATHPATPL